MEKRGFELSFGFIFSIILIAVILFVALYAIGKFITVRDCTETALFYEDFQERVDAAWNSEIVKDSFKGYISGDIREICIGNITQENSGREYEALIDYSYGNDANVFLYPPEESCEGLTYKKLEHLGFDYSGIECFEVINGRVEIPLEKNSLDALVRVKKDE